MDDFTKLGGIVCLTAICIFALYQGIDSVLLGSICAIIGGVLGYSLKYSGKEEKKPKEVN